VALSAAAALILLPLTCARAMGPRETSGTAWQPALPMEGRHHKRGAWTGMIHGFSTLAYGRQGGPRGDDKIFPVGMLMGEAERRAGPGRLALRAMLAPDPLGGPYGYPLLFQTGETGDGRTGLVDRQHPHDLFMELSARYTLPVGEDGSVFAYAGLPGEPAVGPPAFMMRLSSMENPAAPMSHHWLDSTHVAWGVATLGGHSGPFKLDVSGFRGRESDRHRWDIEKPALDSYAARLSWAPTKDLVAQYSRASLHQPEELHPEDVVRHTLSVQWNSRPRGRLTQATFAWGRNEKHHGAPSNAFLAEATCRLDQRWTVFARAETAAQDELFAAGEPLHGRRFQTAAATVGALRDSFRWSWASLAFGASLSAYGYPRELRPSYGRQPLGFIAWARLKVF
jgi:hypothetical protein